LRKRESGIELWAFYKQIIHQKIERHTAEAGLNARQPVVGQPPFGGKRGADATTGACLLHGCPQKQTVSSFACKNDIVRMELMNEEID
jgi:hypothetical protein